MQLETGSAGPPAHRARFRGAAETAVALLDGLWLAPLGIVLLDLDLRVLQANDAFARLAGVPADALVGKGPGDLFPGQPELASAAEERLRAVIASGRPALDAAAVSRAPDGAQRSWRASVYPMLAEDGAVRGVCATVDETTHVHDRERALERARTAADRSAGRVAVLQEITAALAAATDAAEIGAAVIGRVRALLDADAAAVHLLAGDALAPLACAGVSAAVPGAAAPVPASARVPGAEALRSPQGVWLDSPEEIAARFPEVADVARTEGLAAVAIVPLRARGRAIGTLSVAFRGAREFDLEVRALLLSAAEQCALALDRAALLAREREARLRSERDGAALDGVFANAPLGMALLDRELRYVRVNPVLASINGLPVEAHVGRSPADVLPPATWDEVRRGVEEVLATGRPRLEVPIELSRAGEVRHVIASWYPLGAGEAAGVGSLVRDVTADRDAEQFQRNVLGIVGHDLRTPLTTIATAAYLLGRHAADPADARLVARIVSAAARIEQLTNILVDYARASGGRGIPVHPAPCDVAAICREVADEVEGAHPGREIRCRGEGDATGAWDPHRLRQALTNLVTNALQHGAPDAPVEVRWTSAPDEVRIDVVNAGAAIPPDLLPRMFDAFRRGRRDRAGHGGLGLGLFIARAIVVAHGGRIDVRSREGETALTIRLPRRPAQG